MKKILSVLVVVMLLICSSCLFACGNEGSQSSGDTQTSDNTQSVVKYTVSFYDEDGELLESKEWDSGTTPSYSYNKQDTEEWHYTVEGWATSQGGDVLSALPSVTAEAKYYAVVSKQEKTPEITFAQSDLDTTAVKVAASGALNSVYEKKTLSMSEGQKTEAALIYRLCALRISLISGSADEAKEKANKIYADMYYALKSINSDSTSLQELKEQAIIRIDFIYNGAKDISSDLGASLESAYNTAKNAVNQATDILSDKTALENSIKEFKDAAEAAVADIINAKLQELISAAKSEMESLLNAALGKMEDSALKSALTSFIAGQKAEADKITSIEDAETKLNNIKQAAVSKIKEYTLSQITKWRNTAIAELDTAVDGALSKIEDTQLKSQLQTYYNNQKANIAEINSIDTAKAAIATIKTDTVATAQDILAAQVTKWKNAAIAELDTAVDGALSKIEDTQLKSQLQTYYSNQKATINTINSVDTAKSAIATIKADTLSTAQNILSAQIAKWRNAAISELDAVVNPALSKIEDAQLKSQLQTYYNNQKASLATINSIDTAKSAIADIKTDTVATAQDILAAQVTKWKNAAIAELDDIVASGLSKLTDQALKNELKDFYDEEKEKINAVSDIDSAKATLDEILTDTANFAKELAARKIAELKQTVKEYISDLTGVASASAYDYLPAAMNPAYSANLVAQSSLINDYATGFVNVSDINYGGFGAQWNMVAENINDIESCYKFLSAADSVIKVAIGAVNEHLSSKYTDTINVEKETATYALQLTYTEDELVFAVQYKTNVQNSLIGSFNPSIEMVYDLNSGDKTLSIVFSSTNSIKYCVSENKFEFGMCLGINGGNQTSYCSIEKKGDNLTEGKICEFITIKNKDTVKSVAEFYIDNNYVSVIGNKADTITGFSGVVCELYNKNQGKLLVFKVQEELSFLGVKGTYHTLWFNLNDISGITSVKVTDKTNANESDKSPNDTYLNGSNTLFKPTYNQQGALGVYKKTSRKYDVELKSRYFYGINSQTGALEKYEVKVPMMFIQDDNTKDTNYTDYPANVLSDNGLTSSVTINASSLSAIRTEYDSRVETFKENKNDMSSDDIKAYLQA